LYNFDQSLSQYSRVNLVSGIKERHGLLQKKTSRDKVKMGELGELQELGELEDLEKVGKFEKVGRVSSIAKIVLTCSNLTTGGPETDK